MDTVALAPTWLAALFPDGGQAFLDAGGLGASWPEALAHVPPQVLAVPPAAGGLGQLARLRDFWASHDDLQPALVASRALLRIRIETVGRRHPDTWLELGALGALAMRAGKLDEGGVMVEEAWRGMHAAGVEDLRLAIVSANVAQHFLRRGRVDEAQQALTDAYRLRKRHAPRTAALAAAQLAEIRDRAGDAAGALALYDEAWAISRDQLGVDHPRTLLRAEAAGLAQARAGHFDKAIERLRPVHAVLGRRPADARSARVAFELGLALSRSGVLEEGTRCVEASVRWTRDQAGHDGRPHPELPNRLTEWSHLQGQRGHAEEAEGLLLEALEAETLLHGDSSLEVARRYLELGQFCARKGRLDEALGWLDPAASLHRSLLGDGDPVARGAQAAQLEVLVARAVRAIESSDRRYARDLLEAGIAQGAPLLGYDHASVKQARRLLDRL